MKADKFFNLILLFLIFTSFNAVNASQSEIMPELKVSSLQWGWVAHHKIAEEALNYISEEWFPVWDSLINLVKGGSILPDTWHDLGDTPNHLYYPDNPTYTTGDHAIARYYDYYVGNLSIGEYADAVLSASIMSHYWSDLNIPVHTDYYWEGHSAYESDINNFISEFTIGSIIINDTIDNVQQYAIDAAIHAHQYYDDIRAAYPDGTLNGACVNNSVIKAITEEQLTRAISGFASLLLKGMENRVAPYVEITATSQRALIDNSHNNDYEVTGNLKSLVSYLTGFGFTVTEDNDGITAADLNDVDFLVVNAFCQQYNTSELTAISDWVASGSKSVFVTGRGDFTAYEDMDINHDAINTLLSTIGTVIRMNDDNIYTMDDDPNYYKDWYIYTDNFYAPQGKQFSDDAQVFHFFSPNSLYFTETSARLQVLINGTRYLYQSDENPPSIHTFYDDTPDGAGGETIPLVAAESLNNDDDRIIVFGDTSFSDFGFAPSEHHDNEYFIPTLIEWVLFENIGEGHSYLPRIVVESNELVEKNFSIDFQTSENVKMVEVYVNGTLSVSDSNKPFVHVEVLLSPGKYNVTLVAYNFDDQISVLSFIINVPSSSSSNWNVFSFIFTLVFLVFCRQKTKRFKG